MFPKIQFILSVHSPLALMGMQQVLGTNFEVRELPSGAVINPEDYSEFSHAFDVFSNTKRFQNEVFEQLRTSEKPILLVEGKTDAEILNSAWQKLHSGNQPPFDIVPCGVEPQPESRNGGAEVLRRCLEFLSIVSDKTVIAIFDNDRAGNEQFRGISSKAFIPGMDDHHRQHTTKNMHAILLPTPIGREKFTNATKGIFHFLSIEHYFSDDVLKANGFTLEESIPGTGLFEIDAGKKTKFSSNVSNIDASEFTKFQAVFDRVGQVIALAPVTTTGTACIA